MIPAYNAENWLDQTLSNVLSDPALKAQIIICDDGSTDNTGEIASRYAREHAGVRVLRQKNKGAAAARNAAFRASTGRWICFFDADDLYAPGSLAHMLDVARGCPEAVVHCGWAKFTDDATDITAGPLLSAEPLPGWQWLQRAFCIDYPTYPGSFILPRALIEQAGLWDEDLGFQDDMAFFARCLSKAEDVRYCPAARFLYRASVPGSLSKRGGWQSSQSQLRATERAVSCLLAARDSPETRAATARQMMLVAYAQFVWARDISAQAENLAQELCPADWQPPALPGGWARRWLACLVGWKNALRVHRAWQKLFL